VHVFDLVDAHRRIVTLNYGNFPLLCSQVLKINSHIKKLLSFGLLLTFFIALTPWSALHHHEEINYSCKNEPVCKHKLHISSHEAQCLICAAHFEKNYTYTYHFIHISSSDAIYLYTQPVARCLYSQLIATSLRGPPVA
jgi:hypothetical protein